MLNSLLLEHLQDPESSWSCGRFGAIAEFHRDPGEPVAIAERPALSAVTARGAIRIEASAELRPIAYETISRCIDSWGHGLALCLPRENARMKGRTVITELGPDREAVRAEDREALLLDLGLGGNSAAICVRTSDTETIRLLRAACGKSLFEGAAGLLPHLPALSPHRVFISAAGRIEVYQPIPPPTGKSPDGPHTHVLPRLLARGRSHAATIPIPPGWVAAMTLYPPHPLRQSSGQPITFDPARHAAFQALMDRYGAPALIAGKQAAACNEKVETREEGLGHRIGLRQQKWLQLRA
jgi:hypothetical protein